MPGTDPNATSATIVPIKPTGPKNIERLILFIIAVELAFLIYSSLRIQEELQSIQKGAGVVPTGRDLNQVEP